MSSHGASQGAFDPGDAFGSLEDVVELAVAEIQDLRQQLQAAEERASQSDQLLRQFVGGTQDPGALSRRVSELEAENGSLRARLEQGRMGVDRALARIQFLEDRR